MALGTDGIGKIVCFLEERLVLEENAALLNEESRVGTKSRGKFVEVLVMIRSHFHVYSLLNAPV